VSEDLWQGVILAVVGMAIVFLALMLVGALMSLLNRPLPSLRGQSREAAPVDPAAAGISSDGAPVDTLTLVVIAAAVAALVGPSARIRRVRFVQPALPSAWAAHGRVAIQASHRLRKAPR
jgi:Na+-transporting methylmalonyl-CoA/oxaloacetate decarboxylase gamma subunit